ncbi:unnamed protein product [Cuscuta epithymum]|uniref:Symplekin/Pta1 N-terminal domain-containing protein n=1 Tax=Cuscuta epithymum TaxID=186058 RepID=A0AAV0ECJ3_9ASTE|nr:unnamed protein product [Cuscuta epithymum]
MARPLLQEQVLPLLAAANNHGDLDVKLSSLRQAKDVLLSADPSQAAKVFPYLIDLQSSPEILLRKYLIQVIEDIATKPMEHTSILLPVLFASLRDSSSLVVKQTIISGTHIFCGLLEELSMQFHRRGLVERSHEELWTWMIKFKDAVFCALFEAVPVGIRLLALKFLETYILLFTPDATDSEKFTSEASTKFRKAVNISWIVGHHSFMDPAALISDANRTVGILLDLLHSASSLPGSLTISVVNRSWRE